MDKQEEKVPDEVIEDADEQVSLHAGACTHQGCKKINNGDTVELPGSTKRVFCDDGTEKPEFIWKIHNNLARDGFVTGFVEIGEIQIQKVLRL